MKRLLRAAATAAIVAAAFSPAQAVVIGTADSENALPFGSSNGGTAFVYQQVYNKTDFGGPIVHDAGTPAIAFTEMFDAVAFTCWLHRDALIKKLDTLIDSESDDPNALDHAQREKAEAQVLNDLAAVELMNLFGVARNVRTAAGRTSQRHVMRSRSCGRGVGARLRRLSHRRDRRGDELRGAAMTVARLLKQIADMSRLLHFGPQADPFTSSMGL